MVEKNFSDKKGIKIYPSIKHISSNIFAKQIF